MLPFILGSSLAADGVSLMVWGCYAFADRLTSHLGANGAQVLTRLSAFLLLCIGVQITLSGTTDALRSALQVIHQ